MGELGEDYWIELGRRAVACAGWRWMPGMLARIGKGSLRVEYGGAGQLHGSNRVWSGDGVWPDLRDPATVGCLLALGREAWGDPFGGVGGEGGVSAPWEVIMEPTVNDWHTFMGKTEAEALVKALESAPRKESE